MKLLFWIVVLPLLFIAAFFAIANRETVAIDLWPVFGAVTMPLFVALVGSLYIGFLFGALVAWWSGRRARNRARQAARRAEALQRELDEMKARTEAARPRPAALDVPAARSDAAALPTSWPSS